MKQDVFFNHHKENNERKPSSEGNAVLRPIQKKIDDSPRQRTQHTRLTQLQEASTQSKQNGLPSPLRASIESLSGMDLGDVVVHRNSARPVQMNALAYAQNNEIYLGPGQEKHLPHEAWHVVQQRQGRVTPTAVIGSAQVNDDKRLESEADAMGGIAQKMTSEPGTHLLAPSHQENDAPNVIQLQTLVRYESQNMTYWPDGHPRVEKIGKTMEASLDPEDPIRGSPTDATEIDGLMRYLTNNYPEGKGGWHRGHLLNAKLGGLNIPSNLSPFTNAMNTGAHAIVEGSVKRLIGIGIKTRYRADYSISETDRFVNPNLDLEVEAQPMNNQQQEELDIRDIATVRKYSVSGKILRHDIPNRPRSPQPGGISMTEGAPFIPVQRGHSSFQDKRIIRGGWGMLEREATKRTGEKERVPASLGSDDRDHVEARINRDGGILHRGSAMGTEVYSTNFWLDHAFASNTVFLIRANGDRVRQVVNNVTHRQEFVTVASSGLLKGRHGANLPPRYQFLQLELTYRNGNQVWSAHDGQRNQACNVLSNGQGGVLHDYGQQLPMRYETIGQLYARLNGDVVREIHDAATNQSIYVTFNQQGGIVQDHGFQLPHRYEPIQRVYTRLDGNEVWLDYDGEQATNVYLTVNPQSGAVIQAHGGVLPFRFEGIRQIYTRQNGDQVWLDHDGQTNARVYLTINPQTFQISQDHGGIEPGRYEDIRKIYTRQNGNEVWEKHDGELNVLVYSTSNPRTGDIENEHGQQCPARYVLIEQYDFYQGDALWKAHDGEQDSLVWVTISGTGQLTNHGAA